MRRSLSDPTVSLPAPNNEEQTVTPILERDQILNHPAQDQYDYYYRIAWNVAYLIVGHPVEADMVADKVMATLETRERPPSQTEIEKHIRVLARSRALDCLRSPMHRFGAKCGSLIQEDGGEEYEAVPESYYTIGAEEAFFYEEERDLFAQQFAQAVGCLNDLQRVCFVLRFVECIKPDEIAEMLNIPAETVYTQTYRARNRVAKFLTDRRKSMQKKKESEEGGSPGEQATP